MERQRDIDPTSRHLGGRYIQWHVGFARLSCWLSDDFHVLKNGSPSQSATLPKVRRWSPGEVNPRTYSYCDMTHLRDMTHII